MQLGTSLRTRPAAETAALARRLMRSLGITGLTDITALDGLGLPVFVSIRPAGRGSCVYAGKGLTAQDAQAGALMEAVECAVAEEAGAQGADTCLSLGELQARLPGRLSLRDFAPRLDAILQPERPVAAVRCVDLLGRRRPLLPAELVQVPGPDEGMPPLFGWSTNGLASGNTLQEATLHGLLEVLERDTLAMSTARSSAVPVDPQSLPAAFVQRALRWQGLGVRLLVRHLPGELGLPCFEATLHEPGSQQVELARGWGMHFDRGVALARAVCEAAQSRLCRIHSAQPGMRSLYGTRVHGETAASGRARARLLSVLADEATGTDFQQLPHVQHRGVGSALNDLLARLQASGVRHVFRRRMGPEAAALQGLHVVKIIVPGCENILGSSRRAGPRLLQQAAAGA